MTGVLHGMKILDLTRQMAGPYATAILSDHGATVVKIESLPRGDPSRWTGLSVRDGDSPLFIMWNRGKRSVAIDLRAPEARPILDRFVDWADVLVENFRPGVAKRMGLDYESVSRRNPALVYCSVTGFGQSGPLSSRPATDPLVQAVSGVMSVTGESGGDPVLVGVPIADFTGAMLAVQGILLGVIGAMKNGRGQHVDISMFAGLLSALSTRLATYWDTGDVPRPHGNAHSVVSPYQLFRSADGMVMAGTWGPGDWPKFCAAMGRNDLVGDERFATNEFRVANRDLLAAELATEFAKRTTSEWSARFEEAGALFAPLLTIPEALALPQVEHLGLVTHIDHPRLGRVKAMRSPIHLSQSSTHIRSSAPILGEHTAEFLRELGFTQDRVDELARRSVIRCDPQIM